MHRLCDSYARGLPATSPLLEQSAAEPTKHWGETGGTLESEEWEIWVRTGKFTLTDRTWARRGKARPVYCLRWK